VISFSVNKRPVTWTLIPPLLCFGSCAKNLELTGPSMAAAWLSVERDGPLLTARRCARGGSGNAAAGKEITTIEGLSPDLAILYSAPGLK